MTGAALAWALASAALLYRIGVARAAGRGSWPRRRELAWYAGLATAAAALVGPLAGGRTFAAHVGGHLLLGMAAPVLLMLAAPTTLALRALPANRARRLSGILRSVPVRVLTFPVTAATLDIGGLWLLYTTDVYPVVAGHGTLHVAAQAHMLVAGYLFTASIVGVDPAPDRPAPPVRAAVLVVAAAAHAMLGKHLFVSPPVGVPAAEAEAGAMLLYYGGDAVEIVLAALLCRGWLGSDERKVRRGRDAADVGSR